MENNKWKKIIVMYAITIFISLLLFLPIDIITYGNSVTADLIWYFTTNFILNSILVFLSSIVVLYFNSKLWKGKILFRIILEALFAILAINIIQFGMQNILGAKYSIEAFIYIIKDKYVFTSFLEGGFVILMIETIYSYYKRKDSEIEREKFK